MLHIKSPPQNLVCTAAIIGRQNNETSQNAHNVEKKASGDKLLETSGDDSLVHMLVWFTCFWSTLKLHNVGKMRGSPCYNTLQFEYRTWNPVSFIGHSNVKKHNMLCVHQALCQPKGWFCCIEIGQHLCLTAKIVYLEVTLHFLSTWISEFTYIPALSHRNPNQVSENSGFQLRGQLHWPFMLPFALDLVQMKSKVVAPSLEREWLHPPLHFIVTIFTQLPIRLKRITSR